MRDLVEDIVNSFWPFLVSLCWFVFLFLFSAPFLQRPLYHLGVKTLQGGEVLFRARWPDLAIENSKRFFSFCKEF